MPPDLVCDRLVLKKHERKLTLLCRGRELKNYRVALGGDPPGPKRRQGDQKTPEGVCRISRKHKSRSLYKYLHVSYPEPKDLAYARDNGIKDPGGQIKIPGPPKALAWLGGLHRLRDWTAGCIAPTDREMGELWRAVPEGTPIEITS